MHWLLFFRFYSIYHDCLADIAKIHKNESDSLNLDLSVNCPFCNQKQVKNPIKQWKFGNYDVLRYGCICGESFNYYHSKNKSWTIPKRKEK